MSNDWVVEMKWEDPWWTVNHDHISFWMPKEEWIKERLDNSEWIEIRGTLADNQNDFEKPLRWGFRDKNVALMFLLRWS